MDGVFDGMYKLASYCPVAIRVHYKSHNSFRFIAARLKYKTGDDGAIFIDPNYSS